jgi:hypothetical protein
MTELFDSIVHEMMLDGSTWTDISGDVLISPGPTWNRGIMRNGPNDRVAGPGIMTLYLDNSENNSASQLGYYSPGNSNVRTGFNTGVRYRLSFVKESQTFYKYHGRIKPKGIQPIPGQYGPRRTKVIIEDFMGQAVSHALELLTFATSKKMDEVMALIEANLKIAPLATSYATGISTFPTVFDTTRQSTKAVSEYKKLAMSEQSFVYVKGDMAGGETLVSESRQSRTGSSNTDLIVSDAESGVHLNEDGSRVLNEDGGLNLLDETQSASFNNTMLPTSKIGWGNHIYNQIKGVSFPREVGVSNEVLFSLQTVSSIDPGVTTEPTRVTFRDPGGSDARCNGKNMITPVATTDYTANTAEDGGGSDITSDLTVTVTYGTEGAQYTLTNNNAATMYVTKLQFRGIKILLYDPTISIQEDTGTGSSQEKHGLKPLTIKMQYLDDPVIAENFTAGVLTRQKDARLSGDMIRHNTNKNSMTMYGFLQLAEPGQRGEFIETVSGMSGDWFVNGYTAKIIAGRYVEYGLVLDDASKYDFWILGESDLADNTTLGVKEGI